MAASKQHWPARLWLVRHGESAGNVARSAAEAAGLSMIDIADRDMDVPLSALGRKQARALGRWFAKKSDRERPSVVFVSPYVRARETTALLREEARLGGEGLLEIVDERLRE